MRAFLKNYRQSPRKVRLVANVVRGKDVEKALTALSFLPKKAAMPMKKLIESAISNAKNSADKKPEDLMVKKVEVDDGMSFRRLEYRARGSANLLRKRTSRIAILLGDKEKKDLLEQTDEKETVAVENKESDKEKKT